MNVTLIVDSSTNDCINSLLAQRYPPKRLVIIGDKPEGFDEREKIGDFSHGVIGETLVNMYIGLETEKFTIYNKVVEFFSGETDVFGIATTVWKPQKLGKLAAKLAEYKQIVVGKNGVKEDVIQIAATYNDSVNVYREPYHIHRVPQDLGDVCIYKDALLKVGGFGPDLCRRLSQKYILCHIAEVLDG